MQGTRVFTAAMEENVSFAMSLQCMDGRIQRPVLDYLKNTYGKHYVDVATYPGMIQHLAEKSSWKKINWFQDMIDISMNAHGANLVAVVGHHDCAANKISDDEHRNQVKMARDLMQVAYPSVRVLGLFVNSHWTVEKL